MFLIGVAQSYVGQIWGSSPLPPASSLEGGTRYQEGKMSWGEGGCTVRGGESMVIDQKGGKLSGWVEGKQVDLLRDNLLGIPTRLK